MLWCGKIRKQNFDLIKTKKASLLKKKRKDCITSHYNHRLHFVATVFYVPGNWEMLFLEKNQAAVSMVKLFSPVYYFQLVTPSNITRFGIDNNTSTLYFTSYYVSAPYTTFWNTLVNVFDALTHPFFKKLKFKGKGYYIYKNFRNTITPQFGYAHRLYVYAFYASVRFLSKTSIIVFGFVKQDVSRISLEIKSMRKINIFTGRGVRFSRQVIYKKVGKVSSYR